MADKTAKEWLGILVRNIPFILARPDVGDAILPKTMVVSKIFQTSGNLAKGWLHISGPVCPKCGFQTTVLLDFGGCMLSGTGKFTLWFCPKCTETFKTVPEVSVPKFISEARKASRKSSFILPVEGAEKSMLPHKLRPGDLRNVFRGRLVEEYSRAAMDEILAFDEMVKGCVEKRQWFPVTFRLSKGDACGEVCFSSINGYAQLSGVAWPAGAAVPVKWDECLGLLPMLREVAGMEAIQSVNQ